MPNTEDDIHSNIKGISVIVALAINGNREPTTAEARDLLGAGLRLLGGALSDLNRIANAYERAADCCERTEKIMRGDLRT